jgi:hypothetical protein
MPLKFRAYEYYFNDWTTSGTDTGWGTNPAYMVDSDYTSTATDYIIGTTGTLGNTQICICTNQVNIPGNGIITAVSFQAFGNVVIVTGSGLADVYMIKASLLLNDTYIGITTLILDTGSPQWTNWGSISTTLLQGNNIYMVDDLVSKTIKAKVVPDVFFIHDTHAEYFNVGMVKIRLTVASINNTIADSIIKYFNFGG